MYPAVALSPICAHLMKGSLVRITTWLTPASFTSLCPPKRLSNPLPAPFGCRKGSFLAPLGSSGSQALLAGRVRGLAAVPLLGDPHSSLALPRGGASRDSPQGYSGQDAVCVGHDLPAEIHALPLRATRLHPCKGGGRALCIEPCIQACPTHSPSHSTPPFQTPPNSL